MILRELTRGSRYRVMLTPRAYGDLCGCGLRQCEEGYQDCDQCSNCEGCKESGCKQGCTKDGVIGKASKGNRESRQKVGRILALAKKYADHAKMKTPEHMNKEGDGFYAFKASTIRAYWWQVGELVIISHFVIKKRDKLAPGDKKLMEKHRDQYSNS